MNSDFMNLGIASQTVALEVAVRKNQDGPVLRRRRLGKADLAEFYAEAWLRAFLRKGFPDVPLEAAPMEMHPLAGSDSGTALKGFAITTTNPAAKEFRFEFSIAAVQHNAQQIARELTSNGELKLGDDFYYELTLGEPQTPGDAGHSVADAAINIKAKSTPLTYLSVELAPLLKNSKPVGDQDANTAPVFYTDGVLREAARLARQGGNRQPPVETGCVQVGTLCSCPRSGELFVVVTGVLEAQDTESKKLSLEYTGKTWSRLQAILRARQSRAATRSLRFVGQAHGHPFMPNNGESACDDCSKRDDCPVTSCFVSVDDANWSRAVFARQPWHLCHIFGLNAKGEPVDKLFGRHNGNLVERGYRVLPDFDFETKETSGTGRENIS